MLNAPVAILSFEYFRSSTSALPLVLDGDVVGFSQQIWDSFVIKFGLGILTGMVVAWISAFVFRLIGKHEPHAHMEPKLHHSLADSSSPRATDVPQAKFSQDAPQKKKKMKKGNKDGNNLEIDNPTFETDGSDGDMTPTFEKDGSGGDTTPTSFKKRKQMLSDGALDEKDNADERARLGLAAPSKSVWVGHIPDHLSGNSKKLRHVLSMHGGGILSFSVRLRPGTSLSWCIVEYRTFSEAQTVVERGLHTNLDSHDAKESELLKVAFADIAGKDHGLTPVLKSVLYQNELQVQASSKKGELETTLFFVMSLISFYTAEAVGSSGIIGAWVCGLATKNWVYDNLSQDGQSDSKHFVGIIADLMTKFTMLWIGLAVVFNMYAGVPA